MREQWRKQAAFAVPPPLPAGFGRRRKGWRDIDLVVDLAEEPLSGRWWRGVATLSALFGFIALTAPMPFGPLPAANLDRVGPTEAEQYRAVAISPLGQGSETGVRMAANALVEPLAEAPDRAFVELFARLGSGDNIGALLTRSGAAYAEAAEAARLIASVPGAVRPGTSFSIRLGRRAPSGRRPIDRVAFRAGLDRNVTLTSSPDGLQLSVARIAIDNRPLRIRGRVGDGLYWALRASGVSPHAAGEYLRAIGAQLDVGGEVGPSDQFDLILANRRAATGESQEGQLLYAAIDRAAAPDIRLMKWNVGGRLDWVDTKGAGRQAAAAFAWPVEGRITSGFGLRVHPILRFARMHRGIDFGAGHGTPIVAASDGQVVKAGWSGGYGRQVRIAHAGGIVTSYSHMSRTIAETGSFVRQGQLIGYVGSSGLSTGPHLHYEVYRNGTAVNPLGVKFASSALLQGTELERFKARLAQLMAIGTRPAS